MNPDLGAGRCSQGALAKDGGGAREPGRFMARPALMNSQDGQPSFPLDPTRLDGAEAVAHSRAFTSGVDATQASPSAAAARPSGRAAVRGDDGSHDGHNEHDDDADLDSDPAFDHLDDDGPTMTLTDDGDEPAVENAFVGDVADDAAEADEAIGFDEVGSYPRLAADGPPADADATAESDPTDAGAPSGASDPTDDDTIGLSVSSRRADDPHDSLVANRVAGGTHDRGSSWQGRLAPADPGFTGRAAAADMGETPTPPPAADANHGTGIASGTNAGPESSDHANEAAEASSVRPMDSPDPGTAVAEMPSPIPQAVDGSVTLDDLMAPRTEETFDDDEPVVVSNDEGTTAGPSPLAVPAAAGFEERASSADTDGAVGADDASTCPDFVTSGADAALATSGIDPPAGEPTPDGVAAAGVAADALSATDDLPASYQSHFLDEGEEEPEFVAHVELAGRSTASRQSEPSLGRRRGADGDATSTQAAAGRRRHGGRRQDRRDGRGGAVHRAVPEPDPGRRRFGRARPDDGGCDGR